MIFWHHVQKLLFLYAIYKTTSSIPLIRIIMKKLKHLDKKGLVLFAIGTLLLSGEFAYIICNRNIVKKLLSNLVRKCIEGKK